jgi:hypothetical protein
MISKDCGSLLFTLKGATKLSEFTNLCLVEKADKPRYLCFDDAGSSA